ncbi:AAA family ATPase [Nesterenkonia sp. CF4.4]|uniref:AAA family ATPase n=1 Tax=Nesterenkonia sp. CF4.4 TaxID=3373079 RepID=UPI003EE75D0D
MGTSGAGKTRFAEQLAVIKDLPRFEMDNLHWGPGWTPRLTFLDDASAAAASDSWVTEWQYSAARPILARRAHAMIWLDYSVPRRMYWVARRTLMRRATRASLWDAGLREEPLRTIFTEKDHIIRWAWRTRRNLDQLPGVVEREYPHLVLYRFTSPGQARRWLRTFRSRFVRRLGHAS